MEYISKINPEPIPGVELVDLFGISPNSESACEFVCIKRGVDKEPIINLKVESDYHVTFKQSGIANQMAIIGYGNRFAIFDFFTKKVKKSLSFKGYFASFLLDNQDIFLATDSELIKLNGQGDIQWKTGGLGIDGVLITKITKAEITGRGEWDPPGGWVPFKLDRSTGKKIINS